MKKIASITFISSAMCNLNCSFCYLNKNIAYSSFNTLVRQAWKDKTYIKNVCTSLDKLNIDKTSINTISLWGGETLLSITDVTNNLKEIYQSFPNITNWMVSTNWTSNVYDIFDFLKEIDKYSKYPTEFSLQLSIDGPPGPISEQGHNGGWDKYEKNMDIFTNLINNYKFRHMLINVHINAVVSKELYLKTFSTYEGMYSYMKFMMDMSQKFQSQCISESLVFSDHFIFPGCAFPYNDTVKDGLKLIEIFKLWDYVYNKEFKDTYPYEPFYLGLGHYNKNKYLFSQNVECGELMTSLTFNYDGSICECNGSFIDSYQPYLDELIKNKDTKNYEIALVHNKMTSYNPILSNENEINKYKWAVHDGGYRNTGLIYLHMAFNEAKALLKAGQISSIYENDEILFKHLTAILGGLSCSRNNIVDTLIPYATPIGALRRFLNGAAQYIFETETKKYKRGKYSI